MKKIALLQFDERVNDENINFGIRINKKYCELHGYDYIFKALKDEDVHHDLDEYMMTDDNAFKLKIYDYRIKMIKQYMNDYDYLIYLDTDAIIYNPTIKIEDIIDDEHMFFMFPDSGHIGHFYELNIIVQILNEYCHKTNNMPPDDLYQALMNIKYENTSLYNLLAKIITNIQGLASGIIIVNCHSNKLASFIEDFNRFYPLFENCLCDQGVIQTLFRRKKYKNDLKILPHEMQGNPFFNELVGKVKGIENYILTDKTFICHMYGQSSKKEQCRKFIEDIKHNKWWKDIFHIENTSFLIYQTELAFGDTLVTTNFFKDFKEQYPNYKIYYKVATSHPYFSQQKIDIFKNNPNVTIYDSEHVDKVVEYKCEKFLLASKKENVTMNHSLYEVFKEQTGIDVKQNTFGTDVYLTDEEKSDEILNKFNIPRDKPIALICSGYHPLANSIKYIGTKKMQNIVDALYDKITFVQVGDTGGGYRQNILNHTINLIDKTSVRELILLMNHTRFVVSGIHALTHLASMKTFSKRDVYLFIGCRENKEWFSSYFNLENIKYHIYGYKPENYKECLGDNNCCIRDVTTPTSNSDFNKLCCKPVLVGDETIASCMNDIDEDDVVNDILNSF